MCQVHSCVGCWVDKHVKLFQVHICNIGLRMCTLPRADHSACGAAMCTCVRASVSGPTDPSGYSEEWCHKCLSSRFCKHCLAECMHSGPASRRCPLCRRLLHATKVEAPNSWDNLGKKSTCVMAIHLLCIIEICDMMF